MMKKRENELENELADKYADVKEANPNTIQQFGAKA
jgi:hypothetical protein